MGGMASMEILCSLDCVDDSLELATIDSDRLIWRCNRLATGYCVMLTNELAESFILSMNHACSSCRLRGEARYRPHKSNNQ